MGKQIDALMVKIFLMIGRAVLKSVNDDEKVQKVQVVGLDGEKITDVERPQPYGLESYPEDDTEAVIVFVNGNRSQGLVLTISDKENRPTGLSKGDVHLWSNGDLVLNTGDAARWKPNVLDTDPLTGIPHGGIQAGIVKLKGE